LKPRHALVVPLLALPVFAQAEKPLRRKDLPAAVEKTVARELERATLKALSSGPCEGSNKGTCYEVETLRGDKTRDLIVDAGGTVVEVEEEIALADVPEAVKAAAAKLGKVLTAEKITRDGALSYELVIEKAGKKSEHVFEPGGAPRK